MQRQPNRPSPCPVETVLGHQCGDGSGRQVVDSLARRSVKSEVDHLGKVAWDEQADLSGGQTVVAHLAFVGQEGDDVSR